MAVTVPTLNTPLNKQQALAALQKAWGGGLSREMARGLLSLVWIETGGGNLKNNNPGNISAGESYGGTVWRPPWYPEPGPDTPQKYRDLHQGMLNKTVPVAFRAYPDAATGFADFVKQLKNTFPNVVAAAQNGTPDQFRQALSEKYSHDYRNPQATNTFTKLWETFDPVVAHLPSGTGHTVVYATVGALAACGGAAWWLFRKGGLEVVKRLLGY